MPSLPRKLLLAAVPFAAVLAAVGFGVRYLSPVTWYRFQAVCAPRSAEAYLRLGDELRRQWEDLDDDEDLAPYARKAALVYARAAKLDGGSRPSLYGLALCSAYADDHRTAEKSALEITRKHPALAESWGFLGEIYQIAGDYEKMAAAYRQALDRGFANADHPAYAGFCLSQAGYYRDSARAYQAALKADPSYEVDFLDYGRALYHAGAYAEAIPILRREPPDLYTYPEAQFYLECASKRLGRAREAWRQVIEETSPRDPLHLQARKKLQGLTADR
ncbi:MAG: hypothetical protein ACK47B_27750 [Armatimonadota bacterium]